MTHDLTDKGMRTLWQEAYAKHRLAALTGSVDYYPALDAAVWETFTRIRDAAYEEAAKVAEVAYEGHSAMFKTDRARSYEHAGTHIAKAIRSLSKPLEKENG